MAARLRQAQSISAHTSALPREEADGRSRQCPHANKQNIVHTQHAAADLGTAFKGPELPTTSRRTAKELLASVHAHSRSNSGTSQDLSGSPQLTSRKVAHCPVAPTSTQATPSGCPVLHESPDLAPRCGAALPHPPPARQDGEYTLEEVAKHNTIDDCWLVAHGMVFDVTSFLTEHPAGISTIMRHAGQESTEDFDFHSPTAQKLWREYKIGTLKGYKAPSSCCTM